MQSIDDIEVAGRARPAAVRPERPARQVGQRRDHRRRAHPRLAAGDPQAGRPRRPGRRHGPPRPPEGRGLRRARRGRPVAAGGRRSGSPSCSGKPVAFATDLVGPSAAATVAGADATATSRCSRTSASSPRRLRRMIPNGRGSLPELAELGDVYVGDGFGVVHRKQASVYDLPALLPHAAGDLVTRRGGRAAAADRRPGAAVRRRARRVEGVGQARRDRQPARPGRPGADRRRHGVHVPRGARATRSATRCSRPTRSSRASRCSPRPAERGVEIVLPTDIVVAPQFAADAPPTVVAADAIPDGPAWAWTSDRTRASCSRRS